MSNLNDLSAEVSAEIRADVRAARERYQKEVGFYRTLSCPMCDCAFELSRSVTPEIWTTCSTRCAYEFERYLDANPKLSIEQAIRQLREEQS